MATTKKRDVVCPDCGYERRVYAEADVLRCRACTAALRKNGRTIVCPGCNREHYVTPSDDKKNIRYCSSSCAHKDSAKWHRPMSASAREKLSRDHRGANNPNFKDGKRIGDPNRRWSLAVKGERICRNCPEEAEALHHIVPRKLNETGVSEPEANGMPLCTKCHAGWHRRVIPIYRDQMSGLERGFVLGAMGRNWMDNWYPERGQ